MTEEIVLSVSVINKKMLISSKTSARWFSVFCNSAELVVCTNKPTRFRELARRWVGFNSHWVKTSKKRTTCFKIPEFQISDSRSALAITNIPRNAQK